MNVAMNSVTSLKEKPFFERTLEEKLLIKSLGRPTPHLNIQQKGKEGDRTFIRQFRSNVYKKYPWMCGCEVQNALYCFPCLVFGGKDIWSNTGFYAFSHVNTFANKHADNKKHINNVLELGALGVTNKDLQTSSADIQEIQRHNEQVDKNRDIASQIIDYLRDLDTTNGISLKLEQIFRNLDNLLENSLQQSKLFQELPNLVQDHLLQCMLAVCQDIIVEELNRTEYVAVILGDTAELSSDLYLVIIFRYEIDGNLHERFWRLINIEADSAVDILPCILNELKSVFDSCPNKIISLSFEGPSMMQIPADALESKIREHFPKAVYVLSYDQHLNSVIENAASHNSSARKFLSCLSAFSSFFSSPNRLHLLETVTSKRGICPPPGGWDFTFQRVTSVYHVQKEILECCLEFQNTLCSKTVQEARILQYFLEDGEFLFWLNFFHEVLSQVEDLDVQLLAGQVDTWKVLQDFTSTLFEIQNKMSENCEAFLQERQQYKLNSLKEDSQQVCDLIVARLQYCLQPKGHVDASQLLDSKRFIDYSKDFPHKLLNSTTELYSDLNKSVLHDELDVIYERADFRELEGSLSILQFFHFCNLEENFPETMDLLRRIVTVPAITSECDRCPGSMKAVKTLIKNSSITQHLSAVIMIAAEKKIMSSIKDFNKRVLEKLANRDTWMVEFNYRKY